VLSDTKSVRKLSTYLWIELIYGERMLLLLVVVVIVATAKASLFTNLVKCLNLAVSE